MKFANKLLSCLLAGPRSSESRVVKICMFEDSNKKTIKGKRAFREIVPCCQQNQTENHIFASHNPKISPFFRFI